VSWFWAWSLLLKIFCQGLGVSDVLVLSGLVSSGEQYKHDLAALDEIDSVSGPVINLKLKHAIAHKIGIAGVAQRQASDADIDAGTGDSVSQSRKPFSVGFSLLDLDHA
jgi:hypothetical protein